MKNIPKTHLYIYLAGISIFIIGLFLPYTRGLTLKKVNETSEIFEFAQEYYETTFIGYESIIGQFNILILLLISLLFFFTRKKWFKYLLIPIGVAYLLSQLILLVSTLAGFGAPVGDSLLIGFAFMFIGTIISLIVTAVKPIINSPSSLF